MYCVVCVKGKQKRQQRHCRNFKPKLYLLFGICVSVCAVRLIPISELHVVVDAVFDYSFWWVDGDIKIVARSVQCTLYITYITIDFNIEVCIAPKIKYDMSKINAARLNHRKTTTTNSSIFSEDDALDWTLKLATLKFIKKISSSLYWLFIHSFVCDSLFSFNCAHNRNYKQIKYELTKTKSFTSGKRTVQLLLRNIPSIRLLFFWTFCCTSSVDRLRSSGEQYPCFDSLLFCKLCATRTREYSAIKTITNEKRRKCDANFIIFVSKLFLRPTPTFYCCHYDVVKMTVVAVKPYAHT